MKARQIEAEIIKFIPFQKNRTQEQFEQQVKARFELHGFEPFKSEYDNGGNCTTCAESGRCPGWHIEEALDI